jgi:CRISPR/Cas system CMR subunit Cmr6 (Cas7 group RAMP superfamily)
MVKIIYLIFLKCQSWIEEALKEFGVGAKTRLGYGIFEQ